jgi:hypothetical protein
MADDEKQASKAPVASAVFSSPDFRPEVPSPVPDDSSARDPSEGLDPALQPGADRNELVKRMATILGNVAVLTALLVYFGWVRSEVQSRLLGIDESVLGMSTQDYLLRSVRPVLVLLLIISIAGLLWLLLDVPLVRSIRRSGRSNGFVRWTLRLLPTALVVLPGAVWLLGLSLPAMAFIAFPLSIAAGLLLLLYSVQLRQLIPGAEQALPGREGLLRAFTAVVVAIGLFSSAANYATVEGTELADGFVNSINDLPRVVIYSAEGLQINTSGSEEQKLSATDSTYKFRYVGLRLLEHTGGHYFLVTDAWNPQSGTIVMLPDDAPLRLEFVLNRGS